MRIDSVVLTRTLGRLQRLDVDRGLGPALDEVVAGAAMLFGADAAGLWLLGEDGALRQVRASGRQAEVAGTVQEQLGAGPGLVAFAKHAPVAVADLTTDPQFDAVGVVLRAQGVRAVLSVPVEVDDSPIGTLELYAGSPRQWDASELAAAEGYAKVTGRLLTAALNAHAQEQLAEQLQLALDRRVLIEQAKGALMGRHGLDGPAAFELLRSTARDQRRPIVEVARQFLASASESPPPPAEAVARRTRPPPQPLPADRLLPGDHAWWRFRSEREHRDGVTALARAALEHQAKILYLADAIGLDTVAGHLRLAGLDPDQLIASGQLVLRYRDAGSGLEDGRFDPARQVELFRTLIEQARAEQYRGLWAIAEGTWQLRANARGVGRALVVEFEQLLEQLSAASEDALVVCQYDAAVAGGNLVDTLHSAHNLELSKGRLRQLGRTTRAFRVVPTTEGMAVGGAVDLDAWPALSNALRRLIGAAQGSEVVVDLAELDFIDGRGVGMLAHAAWALGPSRRMVLRAAPPMLLRIAETLRLDREPGLVIEGRGGDG
jgi:GAF domain-containing protein/anti-anti-sigma regulatory factor